MKSQASFDDFFNENTTMLITSYEHGRFIEFEILDEKGECSKFKLGYNDVYLLESFLSGAKKY